jgi:CheY-like chemotaxis protein
MSTNGKTLRVLVVDDDRDGADTLGMVIEELGHQVHVTYGGTQALDVAITFRPDLMLVDLVMPHIDGCGLAMLLRQNTAFSQTKIVAVTGHTEEARKSSAMKAGFDLVLSKPVTLPAIESFLTSVVPAHAPAKQAPKRDKKPASFGAERRLPIEEARRIRNERKSKVLTREESEAAIRDGIIRFQDEFLGGKSEQIQAHFVEDLLVVRIRSVLTLAERHLGKSSSPENGRRLIKQVRKLLLELARPMLVSLVHEIAGVKVLSMHHDISTVTGEEIVVFSLAGMPRFEYRP